jgi:RNA polymerase sigma factor (sigma-70 family)
LNNACLNQDRQGFLDALYKAHGQELRRFVAARYGAGPPEPEDVVQSAFAQVAALERPEELVNPRAFLYRTAHNLLIDQRRRIATQRKFVAESETKEFDDPSYELPTERVLIGQEDYHIIEAAILKMPAKRRQCFLLHRLHGLSYAEIGRRVGMSGPGVQKAVEKALAECEQALEDAQPENTAGGQEQP